MKAPLVILAAMLSLACECHGCLELSNDDERFAPLCREGHSSGDAYNLRLGVNYDIESDYFYDTSLMPGNAYETVPSCDGIDGLSDGSEVTFELVDAPNDENARCVTWRAAFAPEPLNERSEWENSSGIEDAWIATSENRGLLDGEWVHIRRVLMTPSRDPDGTLSFGALPPLAVYRQIRKEHAYEVSCADTWVTTRIVDP